MKYTIGNYEFANAKDYEAARRDLVKLRTLEKRGQTKTEIARNYKVQIRARQIRFESRIGADFIAQLNKLTFIEENPQKPVMQVEQQYVVSGRRKRLRNMLLVPFYLMLTLTILVLGAWIYRDVRSRESLRNVQQIARAAEDVRTETVQVQSASTGNEIEPEVETVTRREILPMFTELLSKNADIAGWLAIPGTEIDYPVMYREGDNDYYLSHNFEGEDDRNGLLVLDKRCSPDSEGINHLLIHGHNMRSGAMFGTLKYYGQQDYYREHPTIIYRSLYEEKTYEIFAVFKSTVYNEETTDFQYYNYIQIDNEEEFNNYVTGAKEQSIYDTGIEASWGDCLITLSTCEYSKENGRLVIVGREIR